MVVGGGQVVESVLEGMEGGGVRGEGCEGGLGCFDLLC